MIEQLKSLDLEGIVSEYVVHNFFDFAIKNLKKVFSKKENNNIKLTSTEEELLTQILYNIKISYNWCSKVSFKDLERPKDLSHIYISLDFYLTPKRVHLNLSKEKRIPFKEAINFEDGNILILGNPGAGKTTLLKHICDNNLNDQSEDKRFQCPISIRLRDLQLEDKQSTEGYGLYDILTDYFNLKIDFNSIDEKESSAKIKRIVSSFIDDLNIILLLDGFDEIGSIAVKNQILKDLDEFSLSLNRSRFILSSRTGELSKSIENCYTYEISPLDNQQIKAFIKKWLNNNKKANTLFKQIINSPFRDTIARPLTIAHLCAIFERYNSIPDKPKSIYKKVLYLLLEDWDTQRSISRISKFSNFSTDRKFEFLSRLSYMLTSRYNSTVFNSNQLERCYKEIYQDFDLPISEVQNAIDEMESHTGLFLQVGFDKFEFSHKSIQEYLSAEYITRLPSIPRKNEILLRMPNELAISVAISSNPNAFFSELIMNSLKEEIITTGFIDPFLERLLLEKPDFRSSQILAITLIHIYNMISFEVFNLSIESTTELLGRVSKLQNIAESFSRLKENYDPKFLKIKKNVGYAKKIYVIPLTQGMDDFDLPSELRIDDFYYKFYK